jgi:polysaccharide biosynthesis protein PslH
MKILVVSPHLPFPNWGFGTRVNQLVRLLGEHHQISVLSYVRPDETDAAKALGHHCHAVYSVPAPSPLRGHKRLAQLAYLGSLRPYQMRRLHSGRMQSAIDDLMRSEQFDVVQVESAHAASFDYGDHSLQVLDEHNLEYELLYRMFHSERSLGRRLYNGLEYLKVRHSEELSWRHFAACLATSERERAVIAGRNGGKPVEVIPNGVDLDQFQPQLEAPDPDNIVFTGILTYRPNSDAVVHFVSNILPLIRRSRPTAHLTVVGVGASDEIKRLARPGVEITDWVPDVRPYLARAAVVVVPIRMGSGTRLKVLEAFAMGKAIVSTSVGCEGLSGVPGEHLLIADQPTEFAEEVIRLLANRKLAAKLGEAGRLLVESRYGWPSIALRLERFYARLLVTRSGSLMTKSGDAADDLVSGLDPDERIGVSVLGGDDRVPPAYGGLQLLREVADQGRTGAPPM